MIILTTSLPAVSSLSGNPYFKAAKEMFARMGAKIHVMEVDEVGASRPPSLQSTLPLIADAILIAADNGT
jgi:hypothetical protein